MLLVYPSSNEISNHESPDCVVLTHFLPSSASPAPIEPPIPIPQMTKSFSETRQNPRPSKTQSYPPLPKSQEKPADQGIQ